MSSPPDLLPTPCQFQNSAAEAGGRFYNMTVQPETGDIYVTDAKNYMMNGTVYRFSYDGVKLSSFEAGVIPSAMLFK